MGLCTKLQKWLRDRHWPDNRGGECAAPCHAQSHATGIIAPMSIQHLLVILAKLECPGASCCFLIMLKLHSFFHLLDNEQE